MAKVSISDVGLEFAGNEKASFSKYFEGFLKLRSLAGNGNPLSALLDLQLAEIADGVFAGSGAVIVNGKTLPEPIRHAMYGNYLAIEWWADAMSGLAGKLDELNRFRDSLPPGADPQTNNGYKKLRGELRAKLTDVAERTKPMFGEPWGLIAMDQAAQIQAQARIQITTDDEIYEDGREIAASATAA